MLSNTFCVQHRIFMLGALMFVICPFVAACGDDGGEDGDVSTGTVVEPWEGYCVATFTEDYNVIDVFDDPLFTAKADSKYLMTRYSNSFGGLRAEMLYLSNLGPAFFELKAEGDENLPLTSNCEPNMTQGYIGVFQSVTLYKNVELTEEACTLTEGTVVEEQGFGLGYSIASGGFIGDAIYKIELAALGEQCNGNETVFMNVPQVLLFGVYQNLIPVQSFVGPVGGA